MCATLLEEARMKKWKRASGNWFAWGNVKEKNNIAARKEAAWKETDEGHHLDYVKMPF